MTKRIVGVVVLLLLWISITTADRVDNTAIDFVDAFITPNVQMIPASRRDSTLLFLQNVFKKVAYLIWELRYKSKLITYDTRTEAWVFALHNSYRVQAWVEQLEYNYLLAEAATNKCRYMERTNDFEHISKDWTSYTDYVDDVWYEWNMVWENISYWYRTDNDVIEGFVNSPPHYKNIIEEWFTEIWIWFAWKYTCVEFWHPRY